MDNPTSNYVLTKTSFANHGQAHLDQSTFMPTCYDAITAMPHGKASIPQSPIMSATDIGSTAFGDLESIISDTFDQLYANWNDENWVEREGKKQSQMSTSMLWALWLTTPFPIDSPFKKEAPNPVSPSVALHVIYESERINRPTVKKPASNIFAETTIKGWEHWVEKDGKVETKAVQLSKMTTGHVPVGTGATREGSCAAFVA
jgi:hypothetical protein